MWLGGARLQRAVCLVFGVCLSVGDHTHARSVRTRVAIGDAVFVALHSRERVGVSQEVDKSGGFMPNDAVGCSCVIPVSGRRSKTFIQSSKS